MLSPNDFTLHLNPYVTSSTRSPHRFPPHGAFPLTEWQTFKDVLGGGSAVGVCLQNRCWKAFLSLSGVYRENKIKKKKLAEKFFFRRPKWYLSHKGIFLHTALWSLILLNLKTLLMLSLLPSLALTNRSVFSEALFEVCFLYLQNNENLK